MESEGVIRNFQRSEDKHCYTEYVLELPWENLKIQSKEWAGKLTDFMIDKLQNYNDIAIRSNIGSLKIAIYASLKQRMEEIKKKESTE